MENSSVSGHAHNANMCLWACGTLSQWFGHVDICLADCRMLIDSLCMQLDLHLSGDSFSDRLVGLVVKAYASRAEDSGFKPRLRRSVMGLVCPVSVYCDWVRWEVWSAVSI